MQLVKLRVIFIPLTCRYLVRIRDNVLHPFYLKLPQINPDKRFDRAANFFISHLIRLECFTFDSIGE